MENKYSMTMVPNNFLLDNSLTNIKKLKLCKELNDFLYIPENIQKMNYLNDNDKSLKKSGYVLLKMPNFKIKNINETFKYAKNNQKISILLENITHGYYLLHLLHQNNIVHNNINVNNLITNKYNFIYFKDFSCSVDLTKSIDYNLLKEGNIPLEFKILLENNKNKILPNKILINKFTKNVDYYFSNEEDNKQYCNNFIKYFSEIEEIDDISFNEYLKIIDIHNFSYLMYKIIENNFVINEFITEVNKFLFEIICPPYNSNALEIMYSFKNQYIKWGKIYLSKNKILNY